MKDLTPLPITFYDTHDLYKKSAKLSTGTRMLPEVVNPAH